LRLLFLQREICYKNLHADDISYDISPPWVH
jgi:hypothetical protein